MKTKITSKGMLIIEAETSTEIYALRHWRKQNPPKDVDIKMVIITDDAVIPLYELERDNAIEGEHFIKEG